MKRIFITESNYGSHHKPDSNEDFIHFSYMFLPSVKDENSFHIPQGKVLHNVLNIYEEGDVIMIAFDLDQKGELMSVLVREFFINNGINKDNIFRIPLCEDGFIGISDFISEDEVREAAYLAFLERKFMGVLKSKGLPVMGFKKALVLNEISNLEDSQQEAFEIENDGSCTASFIYFDNLEGGDNDC